MELEGGALRLGVGRPLAARRMRSSVAVLEFEGAEERLGACEEGRHGLPAEPESENGRSKARATLWRCCGRARRSSNTALV